MSEKDKIKKFTKFDCEIAEAEKGSSFYVYYLTCFATIGGLLFGYDTGIISISLLHIGDLWKLETFWKEAIVSAPIGAAAVLTRLAGYLTDLLVRKKVLMLTSFVFTAGAIIMVVANDIIVLLVGRLIVGIGIGLTETRSAYEMGGTKIAHFNCTYPFESKLILSAMLIGIYLVTHPPHLRKTNTRQKGFRTSVASFVDISKTVFKIATMFVSRDIWSLR